MSESHNGKAQMQRAQSKPQRNYTGERIPPHKVEAIINALGIGEPIENIARHLHTSKQSVMAIRERESLEITRRKELIRASAARLAANGFDKLNREMDKGNINGALLVPVTGMATDKVIALSPPDPLSSSYQQNLHLHLQPVDVAGRFNRLLASLEDKVRALPPPVNPNVSGDGKVSADGPPPALTDQSTDTEQRESRSA